MAMFVQGQQHKSCDFIFQFVFITRQDRLQRIENPVNRKKTNELLTFFCKKPVALNREDRYI